MKYLVPFVLILFALRSYSAMAQNDTLPPDTYLDIGGSLAINYANQTWKSEELGHQRGLSFNFLTLAMKGAYKETLLASVEYRFYSFTSTLRHAWIGYQPNERNQVQVGMVMVPFGLLPFAADNLWGGLGFNHGLEYDFDAGITWIYQNKAWDLRTAFFQNEEFGDATNLSRYTVDLVLKDEYQDEEVTQGNARLTYTLSHNVHNSSEWGLSGEYGLLNNTTETKNGYHWQAAAHYKGNYNNWSPTFQLARYEYHTVHNDSLVLMGNLESVRPVAAKAYVLNAGITKKWKVDWFLIENITAYYFYSAVFKDEKSFDTSELHNPGMLLEAGSFIVYLDWLLGRNAWFFNDSPENSGPGAGSTNQFLHILNVNLNWLF